MLKDKHDGSVMKAAVKPMCGIREIQFYEQITQNLTDPHWEMLRKLVPEYRGTVKVPFRGKIVSILSCTIKNDEKNFLIRMHCSKKKFR